MKFIQSQTKHPRIQTNKLWVAENRSRMERNQAKIANKLKKFVIELANIPPKDVIVKYKLFKVIVRDNGKLMPIAFVKDDLASIGMMPAMCRQLCKGQCKISFLTWNRDCTMVVFLIAESLE